MHVSPFVLELHLLFEQLSVMGEWSFLDSQSIQFFKCGLNMAYKL